ncbi:MULTISPECIES: aminoglycoside phosphotransferase family protein [Streptomyces]|uniref:Kinase n=1 Tax=Streptomyces odorifer TaxID=53450 RepID=A0A7Y6C7R6_9ACTN|nr:aminoglycoside phosphotransferase family protein [Streptomyces odorifer]NUV28585.1 kinase [Streptomyces odorifer]NUV35222.1 kinase [Streptomyces sp. KAI-27]NUV46461.1 kinase [Streptomyces sp. CAI-78]
MIPLPPEFVRTTVARESDAGSAWLAGLPGIVAGLLERWECVPEGEVLHGGVGLVVPVRRAAGGAPGVIKVSFPHPGNVHEPDAFAVWGGHGAVLLHKRDDARYAMLLERAGASSLAEVADGDEVARVAGLLSRRLAVPAPPGLPGLWEHAAGWEAQLLKDAAEVPHALPGHTLDAALATVREAARYRQATMVHGDMHPRNILRADREPWLTVDPKGLAGDPAYDGGTLLKTRTPALLSSAAPLKDAHRALAVFAEAAGLDRDRVARWAQLLLVQALFWGRRHGFRRARGGPERDRLTGFAEWLAERLGKRTG